MATPAQIRNKIMRRRRQLSPDWLFDGDHKGGWYDASDRSTMYFTSGSWAGIAEVDEQVGFWLDKSLGGWAARGRDLGWTERPLQASDFTLVGIGWTVTDNPDGTIRFTRTADTHTGTPYVETEVVPKDHVADGWYYVCKYNIVTISSGTSMFNGAENGGAETAIGNYYSSFEGDHQAFFIPSGNGNGTIRLHWSAARSASPGLALEGDYIDLDPKVLVCQIPGYHLNQATTANKPYLRQDGDYTYLEFDGAGDVVYNTSFDRSGTAHTTCGVAARDENTANTHIVAEETVNFNVNTGTMVMTVPENATNDACSLGYKTSGGYTGYKVGPQVSGEDVVISAVHSTTNGTTRETETPFHHFDGNDSQIGTVGTFADSTNENMVSPGLYVGGRGTGSSNGTEGRIYGLVLSNKFSDLAELRDLDVYLMSLQGRKPDVNTYE